MLVPTLLVAALLGQVQVRQEAKDWRLLKSEHFDLYYPSDDLLDRARHFAGLFEDARTRIEKTCGVTLERRISVFLHRSYHDLAASSGNARAATVHPALRASGHAAAAEPAPVLPCCRLARRRAFAFAEPLQDRIFLHCQGSDRWNAWFVRHELVHQLQFQEIFPWRLPSYLIAMKDGIIPQWFWEGFADYGAGIFDGLKDEYVRDLADEHVYSLSEMFDGYPLNHWDYIAVYYLGSMFFRYLEEAVAPDAPARVLQAYRKRLGLTMNRILVKSLGLGRAELEKGFRDWLAKRYAPQREGRGAPSGRITDTREYYRILTGAARWSPDGSKVAWVSIDSLVPEVYVDGRGLLGVRRLFGVDSLHSAPSWSPDGKRVVVAGSFSHRDYLILCDVEGGVEPVRPDLDEVHAPCWSPTGDEIVFSGLKRGTADLYVYSLVTRTLKKLTDDAGDDRHPAWSPDGRHVAFVHEVDGRAELTILELATGARRVPAPTWAQVDHPTWTRDGSGLVVSADVDGVYDAFVVDVAAGSVRRLTKLKGGVHFPQPSPDGKRLLITYQERRSTDVYAVDWAPQDEPGWSQEHRKAEYAPFAPPAPAGEPATPRRRIALDWLMVPVIGESLITPGLQLHATDREYENRLWLSGIFGGSHSWDVAAAYVNARWRPTFGLQGFAGRFDDRVQFGAGPFVDYPLTPYVTLSGGVLARETRILEDELDDVEVTDVGPSLALTLGRQAGWLIFDPSWGFSVTAAAAWYRESYGGDRDLAESWVGFEGSVAPLQDLILWMQARWLRKDGPLVEDEAWRLDQGVRGAGSLEGEDLGTVTLELRFPISRDLRWLPLEFLGVGEWFHLKDVRAFVFADAGFVGDRLGDALERETGAASVGIGLRLDFFAMLWPVTTLRAPARIEGWAGWVMENGEDPSAALGAALRLPF